LEHINLNILKENAKTLHSAKCITYSILVDKNKHWTSYTNYFSC